MQSRPFILFLWKKEKEKFAGAGFPVVSAATVYCWVARLHIISDCESSFLSAVFFRCRLLSFVLLRQLLGILIIKLLPPFASDWNAEEDTTEHPKVYDSHSPPTSTFFGRLPAFLRDLCFSFFFFEHTCWTNDTALPHAVEINLNWNWQFCYLLTLVSA